LRLNGAEGLQNFKPVIFRDLKENFVENVFLSQRKQSGFLAVIVSFLLKLNVNSEAILYKLTFS